MLKSNGTFSTTNASKYIQQLCKHFAHKVEVEYDEKNGKAALPPGPATLVAHDDELVITVTANDDEGLTLAKSIIDDHLVRFAFREEFSKMAWD